MIANQRVAVVRVSRRKLIRHVTGLRAAVTEAQEELARGALEPAAHERLQSTIARIEAQIARLEEEARQAPAVDDPNAPLFYSPAHRD